MPRRPSCHKTVRKGSVLAAQARDAEDVYFLTWLVVVVVGLKADSLHWA